MIASCTDSTSLTKYINEMNKDIAAINTAIVSQLRQENIKSLHDSTGCTSLGLSKDDWSTAYTLECEIDPVLYVSKCMNTNEHLDTRPVHVYFMDEIPEAVNSEHFKKIEPTLPTRTICCTNWAELADLFKLRPNFVCVNSQQTKNQSLIEITNMIETFTRLLEFDHKVTVTLGVNLATPYQLVKDAQKLKIDGIIPASRDFGIEETMKGCNAQWNNIPYWPKNILEQLSGYKKKKVTNLNRDDIKLTPRQEQILYLIQERGSSNKVIAKTLGITESTVKLHVGIVLKKYGVRNRTQLAVYSKK